MTSAKANALIENLYIYLDDGSGVFEQSNDTLVTTVSTLTLNAQGAQTVTFVDGDPNVQVAFGSPRSYFVVVELTANAASQTTDPFAVRHLTRSGSISRLVSTAGDLANDIPLALEFAADVTSSLITVTTNRAPVLSGANAMTEIAEDDTSNNGTLVSELIASQVTDADGPASGIAVIAVGSSNGTWQFATDGVSWTAIGSVSDSSALLLAADGDTRVRFVPDADFNGTLTNGLTFRAWDQSDGLTEGSTADVSSNGDSTPFSAATASSIITVLSAAEQAERLIDQIDTLEENGVLNKGNSNALRKTCS